MVTFFTCITTW